FPSLGALAAMWLLVCPYLGLEVGPRALLAVTIGILTLVLAPPGVRFRSARWAMASLGLVLAFVNFAAYAPMGGLANLGTCAVLIILGGIAPEPVMAGAPDASTSEAPAASPILRAEARPRAATGARPAADAHAA